MADQHNIPRQLNDLIQQQIQLVSRLLEIIETDHQNLSKQELEKIVDSLDEKTQVIEQIEILDREYKSLLESAGYPTDRVGMETFIDNYDPDNHLGLREHWEQLYSLIAECRKNNQVNGGIVELNRVRVGQLVSLLRGAVPHNEGGYDPAGKLHNESSSQTLAKA